MNSDIQFIKTFIVNFIFFSVILYLGAFIIAGGKNIYYRYADIDNFYYWVPGSFIAEDACVGDTSHLVVTQRFVYQTDTGYAAKIVRELYKITPDKGPEKIYEKERNPFIEVREDGYSFRLQLLPELESGSYQWIIYFTYINVHGVLRTEVPPIVSNVFKIKTCTTNNSTLSSL